MDNYRFRTYIVRKIQRLRGTTGPLKDFVPSMKVLYPELGI